MANTSRSLLGPHHATLKGHLSDGASLRFEGKGHTGTSGEVGALRVEVRLDRTATVVDVVAPGRHDRSSAWLGIRVNIQLARLQAGRHFVAFAHPSSRPVMLSVLPSRIIPFVAHRPCR